MSGDFDKAAAAKGSWGNCGICGSPAAAAAKGAGGDRLGGEDDERAGLGLGRLAGPAGDDEEGDVVVKAAVELTACCRRSRAE